MSLLGSNLYCVPYGSDERNRRERKRRGRKPLNPAQRLHLAVVDRGRTISLADAMHELSLEDQDAVIRLVLEDDDLDLTQNPRGGTKLIIQRARDDER